MTASHAPVGVSRCRGWSSKCTERVGLGVIRSRVRPDASCSPTGPRIVGASSPESLRPSATVTHPRHCSFYAYKHQPPKRPDPYNNAMATSVIGLCNTVPIRKKRTMAGPRPPRVSGPRVRRLVQPPTTKTSKAQCLALPTTAIATWNTTYLSAAVDHRLPTHQPPPSIRRHQHNHTTPGQLRPLTDAQTDAFCTDAGSTPPRARRRAPHVAAGLCPRPWQPLRRPRGAGRSFRHQHGLRHVKDPVSGTPHPWEPPTSAGRGFSHSWDW